MILVSLGFFLQVVGTVVVETFLDKELGGPVVLEGLEFLDFVTSLQKC